MKACRLFGILGLVAALSVSSFAGTGVKIVEAARKQIGVTVKYDPAYVGIKYPGGDVPREKGVCTDVVVRALRDALDKDLQKLVHEDMKANFTKYPKIWDLKRPDKNIDHRRVPNLMKFFARKQISLDVAELMDPAKFQPGDLVTCTVPPHLPHIMIVSDRKSADGIPLVIHNIGRGTKEEDRIGDFPLTGHFRWKD
jgi:uncharacterized protein YijF (DUF1287 family)